MAPLKPARLPECDVRYPCIHDQKVMAPLKHPLRRGQPETPFTRIHDRKVMAPLKRVPKSFQHWRLLCSPFITYFMGSLALAW